MAAVQTSPSSGITANVSAYSPKDAKTHSPSLPSVDGMFVCCTLPHSQVSTRSRCLRITDSCTFQSVKIRLAELEGGLNGMHYRNIPLSQRKAFKKCLDDGNETHENKLNRQKVNARNSLGDTYWPLMDGGMEPVDETITFRELGVTIATRALFKNGCNEVDLVFERHTPIDQVQCHLQRKGDSRIFRFDVIAYDPQPELDGYTITFAGQAQEPIDEIPHHTISPTQRKVFFHGERALVGPRVGKLTKNLPVGKNALPAPLNLRDWDFPSTEIASYITTDSRDVFTGVVTGEACQRALSQAPGALPALDTGAQETLRRTLKVDPFFHQRNMQYDGAPCEHATALSCWMLPKETWVKDLAREKQGLLGTRAAYRVSLNTDFIFYEVSQVEIFISNGERRRYNIVTPEEAAEILADELY